MGIMQFPWFNKGDGLFWTNVCELLRIFKKGYFLFCVCVLNSLVFPPITAPCLPVSLHVSCNHHLFSLSQPKLQGVSLMSSFSLLLL